MAMIGVAPAPIEGIGFAGNPAVAPGSRSKADGSVHQ
jgi:hypothetical protein